MANLSPLQLVDDYQGGQLPRNEYWSAMQRFHRVLRDYASLVERAQLDHIEIGAGGLQIVLENGLRLRWDPEDIRTAPNILVNHGAYELAELALITYFAQHARCVCDVGANIGWYSLHLAQLLKERGIVYAFEPMPQTFAALLHNIELNQLANIQAFNLALGEHEGTAQFYLPSFTGSVAASQRPLFEDETNQLVEGRLTTLDRFREQQQIGQIDLIKCDVEGAELFVLKGATGTLSECQPVLMLEMLRKWSRAFDYHPNEIIALLKSYGYRCWAFAQNQLVELETMDESCPYTNLFFLHTLKHAELKERLRLVGLEPALP